MDLARLQKALSVEADRGFNDLEGNQYRFSEFLHLILSESTNELPKSEKERCRTIASQFAKYPELEFSQRQHLVAETRRFLYQVKKFEEKVAEKSAPKTEEKKIAPRPAVVAVAPTPEAPTRDIPLTQAVTYLPGIGSKSAEKLAKLGLYYVRDVLYYYPRDYIDYARQVHIRELEVGETVTIVATVKNCNCFTSPRNSKLTILELTIQDSSGQMKISRFYMGSRFASRGWQEQQKRLYPKGATIAASGLVKQTKFGVSLEDPDIEVLDDSGDSLTSPTVGRIVPVYPLTEGVGADLVRRAVTASLPAIANLHEPIPKGLLTEYSLTGIQAAIANIHFPTDSEALELARRRLVFDEFFYLQLGLLKRRYEQRQTQASAVLAPTGKLIDDFYKLLPFKLTNAQERVVNDILNDLQRPIPMNRLVQGDVGSGKTVVAVITILAAIQSGYQAAFMAPTEVLAEQHYRKLVGWFNQLHLPVELLTGSTKAAKRREIHNGLQTGELPLLVGTHALIQDTVSFDRLGLVVIDEQHRFGVEQRARLQQKGEHPHVLTMTATPIPRTLALTLHGDLDVSQIDELPPGRKPIQTTVLTGRDRASAHDLMKREIAQGRQIYIVLPLVEESEKLDLKSAIDEHQHLRDDIFPDFNVGLLHGRMTSAEKDEAITEFRDNKTQILVSTTVVEVGVDVPNATVMMIEHAERFGLSQLHQLRGRVGRGGSQSFCLLMSSSKSETARQRLKVLEQSQDGFFISEMDMRFRGPGAVLGTRQSGLPDFALASLVEDQEVLEMARDAAERTIQKDPTIERWNAMKAELDYRYRRLMGGAILT
ncbi:ATP-dependent DNA helicase RecG [Cyanobacteria bacterium FACHB-63]|nr:ATP-dependent DNA helicase RecG [Cyanobacteria bacterium FACHB-63]